MGDGRRVGDEPGPRWIHRRGVVLAARFHPADGSPPRDALVRLSLTFGWPAPVPDFVGMGIRILPDGGDLLLASARMDGDHRLTCSRDVLGCALASGLPCRVAGADRRVAAVPRDPRPGTLAGLGDGAGVAPAVYDLAARARPGTWEPLGRLELTGPAPPDTDLRLRPPATPRRWITPLRQAVYRLSQRPGGAWTRYVPRWPARWRRPASPGWKR
jgi:hypothetical protein